MGGMGITAVIGCTECTSVPMTGCISMICGAGNGDKRRTSTTATTEAVKRKRAQARTTPKRPLINN